MKLLSRIIAGANIVDTAVSAGQLKTREKVVQEARLVDTLKGTTAGHLEPEDAVAIRVSCPAPGVCNWA